MKTRIFSIAEEDIFICMNKLKQQIDVHIPNYNYLLFSIHPRYQFHKIHDSIYYTFNTKNYAAFHAIDTFENDKIQEGVTVCCFDFQKNGKINTFYIDDIFVQYDGLSSVAKTANYLNENTDNFHIVLAGLCNDTIGTFIEDVSNSLEYAPIDNIVGGVSSGVSNENGLDTFQFIDKKVIKNGLFILSFENFDATIDVSLGFKPYGITYEVKKAHGAKLYTVDDGKNFPYMMEKLFDGLAEKDVHYLWYTPLGFIDSKDSYMTTLRTVKDITDEYVEFFAPINKGDHFKLTFATPQELIKKDKEIASHLAFKLDSIDIAFNFSCIARQYVLEDKQKDELTAYNEAFNSPLFGFFTFGEIGPDKMYQKLKFYNETSLAVVMQEK
ncbi:MAG TPA: hypothetical protein ENK66_06905 [Arcobacter sp.]|nr:hypothetical protein [Arcobacter sp.]